jgi:hypothetical protein
MASAVTVPLDPATVNITGVRAGDRNAFTVTITADGDPVNLTGSTLTAQARKLANDPDPAALTATVTVTDAANGTAEIVWPGAAVTTMLGASASWTGVWDLQRTTAAGSTTVCAGAFTAVMDVTRP